jgi:phage terminase large subunit-like protein
VIENLVAAVADLNALPSKDRPEKLDFYAGMVVPGMNTEPTAISQPMRIMRLHAQTAMFENGFVFLPSTALWLADYIAELTSFPGSKYDDQVDSTTQALAYLGLSPNLEVWARL